MSDAKLATELLRKVLALTPEPRHDDPDKVVEDSAKILLQREEELAGLKVLMDKEPTLLQGNLECRKIRDDIALLDRQWNDALDWARRELSKRRLAGQRARQAQRAYQ